MASKGYTLVREHSLYLNSKTRETNETAYDIQFEIPDNTIWVDDSATQRIKVYLTGFYCWYNWFEINSTNNTIRFTNMSTNAITNITIPYGNYPLYQLAKYISGIYPECTCTWNSYQNGFIFNFGGVSHKITFTSNIYSVLGFVITDNNITGSVITSTTFIQTKKDMNVYMKLQNFIPAEDCINLDNFSGTIKATNVLHCINLNADPFQVITFNNTIAGSNSALWLGDEMVKKLHITFTDAQGNLMTNLPEWEASLRFEIYDIEDEAAIDMVASLKSIDDTLKKLMMFLYLQKEKVG